MQCPRCQAENREGRRFCAKCAAPLTVACPSCGFSNEPGEDFCGGCGAPLTVAGRPAQPRFASPQTYTPKHLADKILTARTALEGERKQVTVLFADLKGSLELLADRDPEEARNVLDPVLESMMDAVHRYEGTVNQILGDGIMALFGAPVAHEDHAVRACYAAIDLQHAMRRLTEELRRSHGLTVQVRVGLNSGDVVVRAISSDLSLDYTAVGQTTHLAGRMEQLAIPGTTLLTADTLRLVEGYVEVRPLGAMPVKGLSAPVETYELVGAGPRRSRLAVAAARGLTRFVGRDTELEQLHEALGSAAGGRGQVVAIVGEPGVGKSRLVWEVTHSHRAHGWLVLQTGGVSYGKATPYLPVVDLLKGYLQVGDRDEPRTIREKVTGKLLTLDRALEPELPALLALLDVPVEDRHWEVLDPPKRRIRTLEAMKRLLVRESQAQPLLVVFEDLHWIDAETQAALDRLVESLPTTRILLLVNYRPEYRHDWGGKTYYRQLRLDPLVPERAEELLETLLGGNAALAPLKRLLIARTEGNPFFLEESVRSLVDDGVLAGERGAYRPATAVEQVQVPATVRAILSARIDRLPAEDKDLLQTASVIGTEVPVAVLAAVVGGPAEAIEGLYPERLAEHVERLAHHALRGEAWEKAVTFLQQAGAKAVNRSAHREATACFEQALGALRHLPQQPEWQARAIDLHLDASRSLMMSGQRAKSVDHARQAEALAESLGDERQLGRAIIALATRAWTWGDSDRARELGQRAQAIATRLTDTSLQTSANYLLGLAAQARGEYRQGREILKQVAGTFHGDRRYVWLSGAGLASAGSRAWLV